mmetsp:Transcript_61783/g.133890  ORF Transcript_61783/g.133890 Transcript_61783/m.133890 type:complete len:265 (+) Transcript_61783:435-1229(+)
MCLSSSCSAVRGHSLDRSQSTTCAPGTLASASASCPKAGGRRNSGSRCDPWLARLWRVLAACAAAVPSTRPTCSMPSFASSSAREATASPESSTLLPASARTWRAPSFSPFSFSSHCQTSSPEAPGVVAVCGVPLLAPMRANRRSRISVFSQGEGCESSRNARLLGSDHFSASSSTQRARGKVDVAARLLVTRLWPITSFSARRRSSAICLALRKQSLSTTESVLALLGSRFGAAAETLSRFGTTSLARARSVSLMGCRSRVST